MDFLDFSAACASPDMQATEKQTRKIKNIFKNVVKGLFLNCFFAWVTGNLGVLMGEKQAEILESAYKIRIVSAEGFERIRLSLRKFFALVHNLFRFVQCKKLLTKLFFGL